MPLRLTNTLSDRKEEFTPLTPGRVGVYVCGITVYDLPHIGHARFLVAFDTAVRFLRWSKLHVTYVRNWTDVDDKIIKRANERGEDPAVFSARYIEECKRDMAPLGVASADIEPKATEHVPEMIALIEKLIARGHAYESGGDVYFAVRSFSQYGKLSKRNLDDLLSGARVDPGELKRDPLDFALWKATKPGEPESVSWESPWGKGRPGWHIECSAMSQKYLGTTFDVHGGGKDLVFPHHENEIAQSEAASDQPLARFWLHNGFMTMDSEKMSKSLGNVRNIRDLLKSWDGESIRAFLLSTPYRHPISFNDMALADADGRVEYFYETLHKADVYLAAKKFSGRGAIEGPTRDAFREAMEDDLNTAQALAIVNELYKQLNANIDGKAAAQKVADLRAEVIDFGRVLGLGEREPIEAIRDRRSLAAHRKGIDLGWVEERIRERLAARKAKDFARADAIRAEVSAKGVELRDAATGTDWRVLP
ncbi:MAG: cysteine--tRNA ligase [Deltaproteobacteria bacterium]|nr:MAG: cysteine--tRNA ligase [Deltaproteobacteria bacterium]TMB26084.1 MAG: cysteine--tRNA ligase [Deltaproteobacteria bacterium]